ncbi:MAG: universal stress protein [Gammaproteobacteria bacterium]|nr:universal stress protein [Gammaproteobacteria bacterium]
MDSKPNILALIDGSVYNRSICEHAAWLANRIEASVDVVHALGRRQVSSEPANLSGSIGLGARTSLLDELAELDRQKATLARKRGRAILEDAHQCLSELNVSKVDTKLRIGEMVETVLEMESSTNIVVIGKRGEAADFDKLHLGSNLERVVRSSNRPVLVASRTFQPIKRVLVAFDGRKSIMKAIEYLSNTPAFADLSCHLLCAGSSSTEKHRQIEGAAAMLREAGYVVSTAIVNGEPEDVIAQAVLEDKFDVLLMGAYAHSRIRSLIIGSTTTEMIRSCLIPVILFR